MMGYSKTSKRHIPGFCCISSVCLVQSALRDAAKEDGNQGVVAIAKKAQDLYRQQQEIQKKADQR